MVEGYIHIHPRGQTEPAHGTQAVEPPQTEERAGSNPGLFYIPPEGAAFLKRAIGIPHLPIHTHQQCFRACFLESNQNASKMQAIFDDVLMWF